jgi:hypothetical protein
MAAQSPGSSVGLQGNSTRFALSGIDARGSLCKAHPCCIRTGHANLSGGGAGIQLGQHIVAAKDTPLCNARLAILHVIGVNMESHDGGTAVLKELIT